MSDFAAMSWFQMRWLDDPIGRGLREGIKQCGQRLFELTHDLDAMRDTLYRVAGRGRWSGHRIDIMDKRWSGIGEGDHRWWA